MCVCSSPSLPDRSAARGSAIPASSSLATEPSAVRDDPTGARQSGSAGLRVASLLHLPEHVVEIEAGRLVPLRILPDGSKEFPNVTLARHHLVVVVDKS